MYLLQTTETYRTGNENEAKELMEKMRVNSSAEGYSVESCGYTYKTKKSKGEVIDDCYIVKITKKFNEVWLDE